ncbi:MAG: hypothetical protein KF819_12185 [Labilithrix sp.]|nr:hypothetical protein [Labilithrix sp.]
MSREAFTICEHIAMDRAHPTKESEFSDGYRAAAIDIANAIRARRDGYGRLHGAGQGQPPWLLDRDLRDAEATARAIARVVHLAHETVLRLGEDSDAADGVRSLVAALVGDEAIPAALRVRDRSGTRLRA